MEKFKRRIKVFNTNLSNFGYAIEGKLYGMGFPKGDLEQNDVDFLKQNGIQGVLSLTGEKIEMNKKLLQKNKFQYLHLPIKDFGVPSIKEIESAIKFIEDVNNQGNSVVVNCWAGCGRTGTVIACYMIYKEHKNKIITENNEKIYQKKILELRKIRPRSVETKNQVSFIKRYEEHLLTNKSTQIKKEIE